jgi:hypothetical protein
MAQGKDVTAMLPYVSRYMGHAGFASTFYYVHTSRVPARLRAHLTGTRAWPLPQVLAVP